MGKRIVSTWVALVAMGVALATIPAHAACGRRPPIHVWPHRGVAVPTNARVLMTAPTTWRGDADLTLVTAPRKNEPRARVALKELSWRAAGTERFELTPLAALAPSTAYELRSSRGEILGVFTTSVLADTRPPVWAGIRGGTLWREKKNVDAPECGVELIHLEGSAPATDDQTSTDDIRYALWAGKPGAALDYSAPPLTWTTRVPASLQFALSYGSTDPERMDFEWPKERPLRVGVKAYDWAANGTDASEATLE